MTTPYNPPHKVVTVTMPYATLVRRADPDFDRAKKREPYYIFANGRTFRGDNSTDGPYDFHPDIQIDLAAGWSST